MSDTEIKDWEDKVKSAVLYRDSTLSTVSEKMKNIMSQGYEVNGKTMYLSSFGVETLDYFTALDNEKNEYHINGDSDDTDVSGKTNTLEYMIDTDPDSVTSFFTQLSQNLYTSLQNLMGSTTQSSAFTLYDDKQMATDYTDYTTKISDQEEAVTDLEDYWYDKFSSMETALAKINSKSSSISSMLS
jgi:flagellar hook-associated protein 2